MYEYFFKTFNKIWYDQYWDNDSQQPNIFFIFIFLNNNQNTFLYSFTWHLPSKYTSLSLYIFQMPSTLTFFNSIHAHLGRTQNSLLGFFFFYHTKITFTLLLNSFEGFTVDNIPLIIHLQTSPARNFLWSTGGVHSFFLLIVLSSTNSTRKYIYLG